MYLMNLKKQNNEYFLQSIGKKNTISIQVLKRPLFSPIWGHFSVHESEISKFLPWIHMEYFHLGIFVIPGVCLTKKYECKTTAFLGVP